jgi:hypothetical protein
MVFELTISQTKQFIAMLFIGAYMLAMTGFVMIAGLLLIVAIYEGFLVLKDKHLKTTKVVDGKVIENGKTK